MALSLQSSGDTLGRKARLGPGSLLTLAATLFLARCSVSFAQDPSSLIQQSNIPLKPDCSIVFRSQTEVEMGMPFSGFATLHVVDSLVTASDWRVSLEDIVVGQGNNNAPTFAGQSPPVNRVLPLAKNPFDYEASVEAPAQAPIGVVQDPPTLAVAQNIENPHIVADPPVILLLDADSSWSHTTAASQHRVARIVVLVKRPAQNLRLQAPSPRFSTRSEGFVTRSKFLQSEPDAQNGGRVRVSLEL